MTSSPPAGPWGDHDETIGRVIGDGSWNLHREVEDVEFGGEGGGFWSGFPLFSDEAVGPSSL
jgi:hypothetical protein